MQFRKYLTEDCVFLDQDFASIKEALDFLSREFARRTGLEETFVRTLLQDREDLSPTWIGSGTMLPHNHHPEVKDLAMIFIRCRKPFVLEDGNEVRYIFSILTPGSQEQLYLGILQGIGQLVQNSSDKIDSCRIPADLFNLLQGKSFLMGAPITASDLAKDWPRIYRDDPLSKALDLMKKYDVYLLPVFTGEGGMLCGVLDLVDLLKAGFPDYVFSLYDFSMINDFQPLKYFWKNEGALKAGAYARDHRPYLIREDASYPEVFFLMIKGGRRHLLVINSLDELVGIIHPKEIIHTMLRP